jgi:hypothetical protein
MIGSHEDWIEPSDSIKVGEMLSQLNESKKMGFLKSVIKVMF